MTINDFLKVDSLTLSRMTDAEIRAVASGGRKIANQRIMRLKDAKMTNAPAYQALPSTVKKTGGFKTKGDRSALIKQIMQEQHFVRGRTSTVRGWKSVQVEASQRVHIAEGAKVRYGYDAWGMLVQLHPGQKSAYTVNQVNKFWDVYHKIEQDPERGASVGSQDIRQAIAEVMFYHARKGVKNLEKLAAARVDEIYEIKQTKRTTADDIRRGGGSKV